LIEEERKSSMHQAAPSKAETQPAHIQLLQMATAHWVSRLLYLAVQMNLADLLAPGPRTASELARPTSTHAPSLHRLMRTLASIGLFTEDSAQRFALTPLGETLRSDVPGSMRAPILVLAGGFFTQPLDELFYSVQTGKTAFEKAFGMPLFEWLASHPADASAFSATMVAVHGAEPAAVAEAYDFSQFETIVDVGGATGNLLSAILVRHRKPCGVLFDLPHVVVDAPALLASRSVSDRVTIEAGSFFENVPAGGNVYLLSHIIHDWNEMECLTILGNCRRAMRHDDRLLIIEMVLPGGDTPHPGKMFDIIMLAIPGGRERNEAEYQALLEKAGFRLARIVQTASAASIVEALPA
jgi:hypothetical protein